MSASPRAEEGQLERLAVLELKNMIQGQVTREEVGFLTNELRSILSQLPPERFVVMTRESMAVMIDPSVRLEDCVGTCEVDTGRMLGAEWIVTGEVVRFGSSLRVSLKLHNTHTGQLLYGSSAKGKDIEELELPLQIEGVRLMGEVSPFVKQRLAALAGEDPTAQLKALREGALRAR
jgi:TolB-like protein